MADRSGLANRAQRPQVHGQQKQALAQRPPETAYLATLKIDCSPFENLAAGLQQLQVVFRRALLQDLSDQLDKALQQNNVLSFDDLITRLAEAVHGDKDQLLISELQQRFGAALIDEFQDTDNLQWQIFSRIFSATVPDIALPPASMQSSASGQFLYLIGDPKQAIYKFRGADIYSYFAAQKQAQQHYTLSHNWRSHPDLVSVSTAVPTRRTFLFENLDFISVHAGRGIDDGRIGDTPPLVLWQLDQYSEKDLLDGAKGTNGEAASCIAMP